MIIFLVSKKNMGKGRGICSLSVFLIWYRIDDGGLSKKPMVVEEINGCMYYAVFCSYLRCGTFSSLAWAWVTSFGTPSSLPSSMSAFRWLWENLSEKRWVNICKNHMRQKIWKYQFEFTSLHFLMKGLLHHVMSLNVKKVWQIFHHCASDLFKLLWKCTVKLHFEKCN